MHHSSAFIREFMIPYTARQGHASSSGKYISTNGAFRLILAERAFAVFLTGRMRCLCSFSGIELVSMDDRHPLPSEQAVLRDCTDGRLSSDDAFDRLYSLYAGPVLVWLRMRVRHEAADLASRRRGSLRDLSANVVLKRGEAYELFWDRAQLSECSPRKCRAESQVRPLGHRGIGAVEEERFLPY